MDEPDNDVDEMTNEVDEMGNEGDEMNNEVDESNNESEEMDASSASSDAFDITKINVNFLGEWYAVMIDWNAAYEYKQQQVIQQLAQITGIPVELTTGFTVHELHPRGRVIEDWNDIRCIEIENDVLYKIRPVKNFHCPDKFTRRNMLGPCIAEDELYYLAFTIVFEPYFIYRTAISYELVPQVEVVEGECNLHMCQTACTEPFFNRIRSILANCKLNKELSTRIMPLFNDGGDWEEEAKEVYYECNILPFFDVVCSYRFSEENLSGNNLMDHD